MKVIQKNNKKGWLKRVIPNFLQRFAEIENVVYFRRRQS